MAHNIEHRKGKDSCYTYKIKGWHGLGRTSDEALCEAEVRKAAGLVYEVEKQDIFAGPSLIPIRGKAATVRTDDKRVLGIVGSNYGLVQLDEVFAFIRSLGEFMGGLVYESAFTLGHGERFAVGIRIQDEFRFKDDVTYPYLYVNGSFDGSMEHSVLVSSIREVCANTMNAAVEAADENCMFMRHSSGIGDRIEHAKKTLIAASTAWKKQKAAFKAMSAKKVEENMVDKLIEEVFGKVQKGKTTKMQTRRDNITADIHKIFNSDTCKGISGSNLFTALNAVTEWVEHSSSLKEKSEGEPLTEAEIAQNRFEENVYGRLADRKSKLFDFALKQI